MVLWRCCGSLVVGWGLTADCTDVGLSARSYRSARMAVEIVCRLGCPSAFACIHCATRFNLIATCCEGQYLTHHCPSTSTSWIWISENSMLLLRTWVSGACDDLCRVPANSSGRRSPREIRLAPRPSHRCPHPADEPARPLPSAPHTLSGGLEAQSSSPIVLRRAP
jgi:hypothetical protein